MFICPKTGLACSSCVEGACKGGREVSELSSPGKPICPESGLPIPDYLALAKIQPEEVYRPQPMDFSFENAVQGLVSLYALAYGGEIRKSEIGDRKSAGVTRFFSDTPLTDIVSAESPDESDLNFWTKVDEICDVGERLQAGEEVSPKALPKISREEAKRMFHLVMEAQVAMLPPHLLPENQFKCTGCGG